MPFICFFVTASVSVDQISVSNGTVKQSSCNMTYAGLNLGNKNSGFIVFFLRASKNEVLNLPFFFFVVITRLVLGSGWGDFFS